MTAALQVPPSPPIKEIVRQHAEEAASLRELRTWHVRAPHITLELLQRLDERIAAHVDGLAVAGAAGAACCMRAVDEETGAGTVFAATVNAIERRDRPALEPLLALADAQPTVRHGLLSAFGWVSAPRLHGLVRELLESPDPLRRAVGLTTCRLHQVDPGAALTAALHMPHPPLQAAAVRAAGELGRSDLVEPLRGLLRDSALAPAAAGALCLLGERAAALPVLQQYALQASDEDAAGRGAALAVLLQAAPFEHARQVVGALAKAAGGDVARERRVLRACGLLGDVQLVPWLIDRMGSDAHARPAGEAFAMITGADLSALALDRPAPDPASEGPDEDAGRDDVALDEDDDLPWPDRERVQAWWAARASRQPAGNRSFCGAAPGLDHCEYVLKYGTQRQRTAAARHLCLLQPERKLFNCAAPAWRQWRGLGLAA